MRGAGGGAARSLGGAGTRPRAPRSGTDGRRAYPAPWVDAGSGRPCAAQFLVERRVEWFGSEGTVKVIGVQAPSMGRVTFQARSPLRPGLEQSRGWGIHSLAGQPAPVPPTALTVKHFFLIPNLSSFSLKRLPLISSRHSLVKSPSPALLQAPVKDWKVSPELWRGSSVLGTEAEMFVVCGWRCWGRTVQPSADFNLFIKKKAYYNNS